MSTGLFDYIEIRDVPVLIDEFRTKVHDLIQEFFEGMDVTYAIESKLTLNESEEVEYYKAGGLMLENSGSLRDYYDFSTDDLCRILADLETLTRHPDDVDDPESQHDLPATV